MKYLASLAASAALFIGAAQASEHLAVDNGDASRQIILAQAGGGGTSSGNGGADPSNANPHLAPPNAPGGPQGAGGTAGPRSDITGSITPPPAVDNNNSGSGGANTDGAPIDPRKTPPNAPTSTPR